MRWKLGDNYTFFPVFPVEKQQARSGKILTGFTMPPAGGIRIILSWNQRTAERDGKEFNPLLTKWDTLSQNVVERRNETAPKNHIKLQKNLNVVLYSLQSQSKGTLFKSDVSSYVRCLICFRSPKNEQVWVHLIFEKWYICSFNVW